MQTRQGGSVVALPWLLHPQAATHSHLLILASRLALAPLCALPCHTYRCLRAPAWVLASAPTYQIRAEPWGQAQLPLPRSLFMVTAYLRDDKSKDFNTPTGGLILPGAEVECSLPGGHRQGEMLNTPPPHPTPAQRHLWVKRRKKITRAKAISCDASAFFQSPLMA